MDVVVTPDGRAFGGTFFPKALRPSNRSIQHFQVVQDHVDHVSIKVVTGPEFSDASRNEVLDRLRRHLGPDMQIDLEVVDSIPVLPSGKHSFIVSKIKTPSES